MGEIDCELVLDAEATLGEGALWDVAAQRLLWVDIVERGVHRFDPVSGADSALAVPTEPGTVVSGADGRLVVALADGAWALDPATGGLERVATVPHDPATTRLNDGKCDPGGRLWVGSLARDVAPGAACLYRIDPDGAVTTVLAGVTISNGIAWSPDGGTMYYIDTPTQRVDAFDFDPVDARLSGRRPVVVIAPEAGAPDGMTVDADGCLWVAMWDGGSLRRYRPDGTLDAVVEIGTPRVTSCAFGGAALDELYVTTARIGVDPEVARQTRAGALYRVRPGVTGVAAVPFGGAGDHGVTRRA